MHHIYNNTAPTYLSDLVSFSSTRSLRSTTNGAAAVQRTRTRLGDRAFSIAGPRVWNNLPASLRQTVSAAAFKRQLKTYLCSCGFDSELYITLDFIFLYFIVVMHSRLLFLCMLRTTNPSFDLIWFDTAQTDTRTDGRTEGNLTGFTPIMLSTDIESLCASDLSLDCLLHRCDDVMWRIHQIRARLAALNDSWAYLRLQLYRPNISTISAALRNVQERLEVVYDERDQTTQFWAVFWLSLCQWRRVRAGTHWRLIGLVVTHWRQIGDTFCRKSTVAGSQSTLSPKLNMFNSVDFVESGWFLSPECRTSFRLCCQCVPAIRKTIPGRRTKILETTIAKLCVFLEVRSESWSKSVCARRSRDQTQFIKHAYTTEQYTKCEGVCIRRQSL